MNYNQKSPSAGPSEATPTDSSSNVAPATAVTNLMAQAFGETSTIGSPLKKQRPSADNEAPDRSAGFPSAIGDVLGRATTEQKGKLPEISSAVLGPKDESDEEL
jgi:hypothetical protein